ncbi:PepSY domain-containing protein [Actinoplanes sp. NPDC049118]|uniref:PepSY domain-containing protein n=1 Tax=Actinoplanes sp. NPDC049118 TaxID=3155769 RepID=UPI0033E6AC18
MRKILLVAAGVAGVGLPLLAGTALATAKDSRDATRSPAGFEIEIDPELDARFGPRPVNAVQAGAIVTRRFPGARIIEAELDERGGGPIWEVEFSLGGDEREVDVDAVDGTILSGDDDD